MLSLSKHRIAQFVRNKAGRYGMDHRGVSKHDKRKYCQVLSREFPFVQQLNSMARQAAAERAWSAISRFYENCKQKISGKKGYPQFKKKTRSAHNVERCVKLLSVRQETLPEIGLLR